MLLHHSSEFFEQNYDSAAIRINIISKNCILIHIHLKPEAVAVQFKIANTNPDIEILLQKSIGQLTFSSLNNAS